MNRTQHSVLLASLLAFALAGCGSTKGSGDDTASTTGATASGAGSMPTRSADTGTGGTAAATGSGSMAAQTQSQTQPSPAQPPQAQPPGAMPGDTATMPAGMPNAIVMSIEPMPRPGAVGASGTAGATGSSMGEDKVYRITLRMDDGTTRVVTQEKAPTYRSGDRVNMMDGVISR